MGFKVPGSRLAVGYWGNNIRCVIEGTQVMPRISALQFDQLLAGGLRARLWQTVHPLSQHEDIVTAGILPCTCVKPSGKHADRRCYSCHGNAFVPGFALFGYATMFVASISSGLTTSNVVLNKVLHPHRWELADNALTGTITSKLITYTRPLDVGGVWEVSNNGVIRDPDHSTMTVEVSINGGAYAPFESIPMINPTGGTIQFRVTLSRTSLATLTPAWEILRARFPVIAEKGRLGPWILVLKSVSPNKLGQDPRGIMVEGSGNRFWTKPLCFFSCRIPSQPTLGAAPDVNNLIRDQAFIEFLDGVQESLAGFNRWSVTDTTYDDPLGYFTRQSFNARQEQDHEYTQLVFLAPPG